jgi:hypothetical protein
MGQRSDKTQPSIATVESAVRLPPRKEQPREYLISVATQ